MQAFNSLLSLLMVCLLSFSISTQAVEKAETKKVDQVTASVKVEAVNINIASADELASTLKGIGKKKAQAIIDFRKLHGPFAAAEELAQVKGIGEATIKKNKGLITVK